MFEGFYVIDTETTGLDFVKNDVIEVSILRLSNDEQKTWFMKPLQPENIEASALRINGYKLEDLCHQTKYGKDTFLDPYKCIVEIENWLLEDNMPAENRIIVGQNPSFDKNMLEYLWRKCEAQDSFPFGRRLIDTMQFEVFMDLAQDTKSDSYSLNSIIKKYGIKNDKAHTAAADVKATKEVFIKQIEVIKKLISQQ